MLPDARNRLTLATTDYSTGMRRVADYYRRGMLTPAELCDRRQFLMTRLELARQDFINDRRNRL